MSSSEDLEEQLRKEKLKLSDQLLEEMKLKNDRLFKRHTEVLKDRIAAEKKNSAVTNVKLSSKSDISNEQVASKKQSSTEYSREWDKGKPDIDNWESPGHCSSLQNYRSSFCNKELYRNDAGYNEDHKSNWKPDRDRRNKEGYYSYKEVDSQERSKQNSSSRRERESEHAKKMYQNAHLKNDFKKSEKSQQGFRSRSTTKKADYVDKLPMVNVPKKQYLCQNDRFNEDLNNGVKINNWLTDVHVSNNWTKEQLSMKHCSKKAGHSTSKFDRYKDHSSLSSDEDENILDSCNQEQKPKINYNVLTEFCYAKEGSSPKEKSETVKQIEARNFDRNSSCLPEKMQKDSLKITTKYDNKEFKSGFKDMFGKSLQGKKVLEKGEKNETYSDGSWSTISDDDGIWDKDIKDKKDKSSQLEEEVTFASDDNDQTETEDYSRQDDKRIRRG